MTESQAKRQSSPRASSLALIAVVVAPAGADTTSWKY